MGHEVAVIKQQLFALLFLSLGGCKQERLDSNLFVRKSDLICFNCCDSSSKVRDEDRDRGVISVPALLLTMRIPLPTQTSDIEREDTDKIKDKFDAYHKFDTTEKDVEKVTKL